jgi:hypothetical protein
LEHARLTLRRFGITVDRGRLVREAIAVLLADLDARGETSLLARRIRNESLNGDAAEEAAGGRSFGSAARRITNEPLNGDAAEEAAGGRSFGSAARRITNEPLNGDQ